VARAAKRLVVEKSNVAATGADPSFLGHIGHRPESAIHYTVRTAHLLGHFYGLPNYQTQKSQSNHSGWQ
jgi:hypothetical protein